MAKPKHQYPRKKVPRGINLPPLANATERHAFQYYALEPDNPCFAIAIIEQTEARLGLINPSKLNTRGNSWRAMGRHGGFQLRRKPKSVEVEEGHARADTPAVMEGEKEPIIILNTDIKKRDPYTVSLLFVLRIQNPDLTIEHLEGLLGLKRAHTTITSNVRMVYYEALYAWERYYKTVPAGGGEGDATYKTVLEEKLKVMRERLDGMPGEFARFEDVKEWEWSEAEAAEMESWKDEVKWFERRYEEMRW